MKLTEIASVIGLSLGNVSLNSGDGFLLLAKDGLGGSIGQVVDGLHGDVSYGVCRIELMKYVGVTKREIWVSRVGGKIRQRIESGVSGFV